MGRLVDAVRFGVSAECEPSAAALSLAGGVADRSVVGLVVVDSLGQEVARGSSWRLNVSAWAPGVYHARVVGDRQLGGVVFTVVR